MRLVKSLSIKWQVTSITFLVESDNRRSWARGWLVFRKSGMIQEELTGNTVAYVHRNLDESANLATYTDKVTGSVWSLSPCPRHPSINVDPPTGIQHLSV